MGTALAILGGITALVLVVALMIGTMAFGWGFSWVTAPFRGAVDAREQIQASGTFRIEAYTSFYNQCASIQALEGDMETQVNFLSANTNDNDRRILLANITALEGTRAGAISRYNIDSHKQWTIAQFKSRALAYALPTSPYLTFNAATSTWQKGAKTVCVVD